MVSVRVSLRKKEGDPSNVASRFPAEPGGVNTSLKLMNLERGEHSERVIVISLASLSVSMIATLGVAEEEGAIAPDASRTTTLNITQIATSITSATMGATAALLTESLLITVKFKENCVLIT